MSNENPEPVIAVLGADGLLGEAVLAALADSGLPVAQVRALVGEDAEGQRLAYGDIGLRAQLASGCDWQGTGLVLATDDTALAAEHLPRARRAGVRLLDASGWLAGAAAVPVAVAELNEAAWLAAEALVLPDAVTVALARLLKPLAAAGLEHVGVTVLRCASADGRPAIEELANQTVDLLNARPLTPCVYPRQIAFNVLPGWNDPDADGASAEERALDAQLAQVLGLPVTRVATTLLRVPTFYGLACVVHLRLSAPLTPEAARARLDGSAGVELMESDEAPVSPVEDGVGQSAVRLGALRAAGPQGLNLWIVADNVALAASNGAQVANTLIGTAT